MLSDVRRGLSSIFFNSMQHQVLLLCTRKPILSQLNPLDTFTPYSCESSNIALSPTTRTYSGLLPLAICMSLF